MEENGEKKGLRVSKGALLFLGFALVVSLVLHLQRERDAEESEERIGVLEGLPALPKKEVLSAPLARALGEAYELLGDAGNEARALEELSLLYQANGFSERARSCFELLLALEPKEKRWALHLAALSADFSDPSDELSYRRLALELGARSAKEQLALAGALAKGGKHEEAELVLDEVISMGEGRRDAWMEKASLALRKEDFAGAAERLEQAKAIDPDYAPIYELLIEAYGGMADVRKLEAKYRLGRLPERWHRIADPVDESLREYCLDPLRLLHLGVGLGKTGSFGAAVGLLERALEFEPALGEARLELGALYRMSGDVDKSIEVLMDAMNRGVKEERLFIELAESYAESKAALEGLATVRLGLDAFPLSSSLYRIAGGLHESEGMREEAILSYAKAIEIDASDSVAIRNLGLIKLKEKSPLGVDLLERRLRYVPEDLDTRLALGDYFLKRGEIDEVPKYLEEALLYDPENPVARMQLAKAYARQGTLLASQGEAGKAIDRLNQALLVDADVAEVHEQLGMLQEHLEKRGLAIEHYSRYVELMPEDSGGYLKLGRVLIAEGERERAKQALMAGRGVALGKGLHVVVHEFDSLLDVVE